MRDGLPGWDGMLDLDGKLNIITPYTTTLETLGLMELWNSMQPSITNLQKLMKQAATMMLTLCIGQLAVDPDENPRALAKQVQDAYKLADSLNVKKDAIPPVMREVLEGLKKGKGAEQQEAVAAGPQAPHVDAADAADDAAPTAAAKAKSRGAKVPKQAAKTRAAPKAKVKQAPKSTAKTLARGKKK